jgi:hypothetical protein
MEGYCITIPKFRRKKIPYLGFFVNTMGSYRGIALPKQNLERMQYLHGQFVNTMD